MTTLHNPPTPEGLKTIQRALDEAKPLPPGVVDATRSAYASKTAAVVHRTFTVWVMHTSRTGTTYVTDVQAPDVASAKQCAITECALNWGGEYPESDLFVLGVAEGPVSLLEWDDDFL